jgi:hypothetical protein
MVSTSQVMREKAQKQKQADHHHLIPAQILDEESTFCTKSFLIRYCEEEVEINDIGHFRTEIDVSPEYLNTEFFLEYELMFSDLQGLGGPERWQQHQAEVRQ